jgi:hypothetical protein|tara:strand:- start:866 stop:1102 length:237 start_codon:yes stop_codon:yes gene_type:complete
MAVVFYIKDFLRIADVDLLYEGLKMIEDRIWEEADVQSGLDAEKLQRVEDLRCSILQCLEHISKEKSNEVQLDTKTNP